VEIKMPTLEFITALAVVASGFGGIIKKLFDHEARMSRMEGKIDALLKHNNMNPDDMFKKRGEK